ncbi:MULTISPECIES: hypothetical protein [unclassified Microbulbifer]|uniref:hypothetical protein n=1 Tax=unclassified Microbulbifer TaxID=2619833 RepID=UPI0027E592FD|nr:MULTISPECIES: hypothetical protein [unclassified Microbulbifer]
MKQLVFKYVFLFTFLLTSSVSAFAAQTATGLVSLWSISQTPGFSLIAVDGTANGGNSVFCAVDATAEFGSTLMSSAATAAVQGVDVTLTCSDAGQAQQLQMLSGSD